MKKILIIDDEKDVRESMAKALGRAGFEVSLAETGSAGMQVYRRGSADLIITDVIMPGLNGVDFIKKLRQGGCAAPIIAISGGGNLEPQGYAPEAITTSAYLAAAEKAGADAVLTKPFERKELLELVDSVLARRHAVA